ncbi:unnamed protein product [Microthlaspi erraticum]|uniref:Uncharacterized protein n=1 Tax=Microthlaspi erraticum TaxID=1685480 RepID=A0A6D2KIN0_9BRAS|nr:unnamed protein product [Microthlaspi erraticum]
MTLEQKPAKGTSLTEALTVDRHASSAKFLRSYNQKSEDCPDGSIENQRPTAQSGWPRNYCFTLGQIISVRLKSRPKFKPTGRSRNHDPGNIARGRPSYNRHATPRTTMPREPGTKPRGRATLRVPRPMHPSEPGKNVPRPAEKPSAKSFRPTTPADRESSGHDRSDSATTRLSGRSSRPTVPTPRSTRSPF